MKPEEKNPLEEIKQQNISAVEQINTVLSITLGHKFGRMMSAGFGILLEYFLYALALGVFIFIFIMEKVSPFYVLAQMRENEAVQDALNPHIIDNFSMVVKVTIGLIAFFIFTTAWALRRVRKGRSKMQDAIITLRDVRDGLEQNNQQLDTLNEVSEKMATAANTIAHETSPNTPK